MSELLLVQLLYGGLLAVLLGGVVRALVQLRRQERADKREREAGKAPAP